MSYLTPRERQEQLLQSVKKSVRVVSNGVNYNLGATVTDVDGVTLNTNDRVLLKDQADATQNGVYFQDASDFLVRTSDFNSDSEVTSGTTILVEEGNFTNTQWCLVTANPITLGVSNLTFQRTNSLIQFRRKHRMAGKDEVNGVESTKFLDKEPFNPSDWGVGGVGEFRFGATLAVSDGALTGEVQLYNVDDAEFVTLTGGALTTSSTGFQVFESGPLTVGAAAGNLKNSEKIYEVRILNDGTLASEKTFLGSAWIRIN